MLSSIFNIEFNPHKHLAHWERIALLARGMDAPPVTLELDVCSICNHSCKWCVDPPGTHSRHIMPVGLAEKIMNEAKQWGVKGIVFKGGGESTLHPLFDEIIDIADELGFELGLVTHGGNLGRKKLVDSLVRSAAYVRVSIDGPTRESREAIHGADDFDRVVDGVKKLIASRGSERHPVIGATFCIEYSRRDLVRECIDLGERLSLDYVVIRPPFCEEVGFEAGHSPRQAATLRAFMRKAAERYSGTIPVIVGNWVGDAELEKRSGDKKKTDMPRRDLIVRNVEFNGIEHKTGRCLASPLFLVVTAAGDVYGCCCLRGIEEFSFGRIDYDAGFTLSAVLEGEKRKQNLARMRKVECLKHCTHPLGKINELIEYCSLPRKYHSSFI